MFPRGARYEGEFQLGKFHGYGVYRSESGVKYEVMLEATTINGDMTNNLLNHCMYVGTICGWTSKGKRSGYST